MEARPDAVLGSRAGRDGERRRTHRAVADQKPAVQETAGHHAPQDGRLRGPQGLQRGCQHGPNRRGGCALRPGSSRRPRCVRRRQGQREDARGGGRKIEIAYPEAFCRAAKAGGARVCGVMTAAGANPKSGMKYAKIIGEKEKAVESVKFDFLGIYRPAVILGNANTPSVLNYLMPLLHWAMPSKYHSIHKNDLPRAMVAQSEQALAMAQGNAPKGTTVKILEYKDMEPFFIKGERDEP